MNIVVVGAGAMGSLFGALLSEGGHTVTLLDIWREHVEAVNRNGLMIENAQGERRVALRAVTGIERPASADAVVVFVKSMHTAGAAATAAAVMKTDGCVLTLQNGMGNAEQIAAHVAAYRILAGTTAHGATLLGPGRIRHAGRGPTIIGPWQKDSPEAAVVMVNVLNAAGIETATAADVQTVLWNKLLVNVGINAVTALTGIKNGQLLDSPDTRELTRSAVEEAMAVARRLDVAVRKDAVEHVFQVAEATAANRSSMGQDVDAGRPTEIEAINGFVVRKAETCNVPTPVNRTLTTLVKTRQAHYGGT